jgi:hypothetical protein
MKKRVKDGKGLTPFLLYLITTSSVRSLCWAIMFTHCIIMYLLSSESTRVKNGEPAVFMLPTRPCLPYKIDASIFRSVQMKTHTCFSLGPPTESKKMIKIVDSEHLCNTYGNERLNFAKQQLHTKVVVWILVCLECTSSCRCCTKSRSTRSSIFVSQIGW